jgi:hypothetical protein
MINSKIQNSKFKIQNLFFVLVLLLAAFLRLYQLPTLPPGLNFDEAGNGVAALDILNGAPKLWWRIGGGKEPLWPYLVAVSAAVLGNVPLALRLPAALVGVATVAAAYALTLRLFRTPNSRHAAQARLIALLTMLGMALSGWHLHFSRLGFRAILLPLLATLAFIFLWRGLARCPASGMIAGAPRMSIFANLVLAALFTALAIYSYLAARLLPLIPLLFGGLYWLTRRRRTHTGCLTLFYANYLFLTFVFLTPLVLYFFNHPADLTARVGAVSIFSPAWHQGNPAGALWRSVAITIPTFLGGQGDANPLVNLPGQPAVPLLLAPFFVAGLLTSLYYAGRARPVAPCPYLFLLLWWGVLLLPALLAPQGAPHHLRLIGALPPTYIFIALGMATALKGLARLARFTLSSAVHFWLPAAVFALVGWQTAANYFVHWPAAADFTLPFDLYAVRLADQIAAAPPGVTYVLPMDIRAGAEARHYTLDYLLARQQPPAYLYIPVDERAAQLGLAQAAAGQRELRLVRWTADKHHEADAKEMITFLLSGSALKVGGESFPVYDVETYRLLPGARFVLPAPTRPLNADFDGLIRLVAVSMPGFSAPGQNLPVALTLAPLAPMPADYKLSLRLLGPTGERLAQVDRTLRHNYHQGTSVWPPETVNEYYLLPLPSGIPAANYTVAAVIYHPNTQAPLISAGQVELPLGRVYIE